VRRDDIIAEIDGAINVLHMLRRGVQQPDVHPEVLAQVAAKLPRLRAMLAFAGR
jgi:hypothetical protein